MGHQASGVFIMVLCNDIFLCIKSLLIYIYHRVSIGLLWDALKDVHWMRCWGLQSTLNKIRNVIISYISPRSTVYEMNSCCSCNKSDSVKITDKAGIAHDVCYDVISFTESDSTERNTAPLWEGFITVSNSEILSVIRHYITLNHLYNV